MLGMDQSQRSNAVGFNPSYLPDGEGSRHGGGTLTGSATEPTIQDYENFFGPSARDIKTDLQRFKRHGRWHLPDILQGPNPWLTDRIDGLITDATNSPFTTKILPYRYKEEVDGKIKWNVWNFDEGMASRVPYESAARTLTQSKRSFAGYMVRQGMAIVLEHNFMMSPKGRENFKNQLNQLIGSIQYTNDLDVHMALILAPSFQKTMRERYYTADKSASQMCREFADLFGMMQKNVNALDILIEEGKAILRTWGGPMPDFLLCNSKLTFQMTMTPEKTNYITQGIDGVKRLRQGPDLGSYRGLSIVHSRAFSMETGMQPRDPLRRRVRTAEYYRIPPDRKNINREFELYNEERDTWFTLSFHELLKLARYHHRDGGNDNASQVESLYHTLLAGPVQQPSVVGLGGHPSMSMALGKYVRDDVPQALQDEIDTVLQNVGLDLERRQVTPVYYKMRPSQAWTDVSRRAFWYHRGFTDNLGVRFVAPNNNYAWDRFLGTVAAAGGNMPDKYKQSVLGVGPVSRKMLRHLFERLRRVPLNDPFMKNKVVQPGSAGWFAAYTFYLEIFKRGGLPMDMLSAFQHAAGATLLASFDAQTLLGPAQMPASLDITCQVLTVDQARGSVNHPFHMRYPSGLLDNLRTLGDTDIAGRTRCVWFARGALLTSDVLYPLLARYKIPGKVGTVRGIDALCEFGKNTLSRFSSPFGDFIGDLLRFSYEFNRRLLLAIQREVILHEMQIISEPVSEVLCREGISTVPMFGTSLSHLFHRRGRGATPVLEELRNEFVQAGGQLSISLLGQLQNKRVAIQAEFGNQGVWHTWFEQTDNVIAGVPGYADGLGNERYTSIELRECFKYIRKRLTNDPTIGNLVRDSELTAYKLNADPDFTNAARRTAYEASPVMFLPHQPYEVNLMTAYYTLPAETPVVSISPMPLTDIVLDLNEYFDPQPPDEPAEAAPVRDSVRAQDVEIVIVRPNIEHNMLGVIMGLGGESLGNTLWGQTELSVYDDSMHGIWGMSYKYHERAIVFNEKNLIRMWDIAYDGYNGGKDDTAVDWLDNEDGVSRFGPERFKQETQDLSKNYRGPSMMVMAFVHDKSKLDDTGHRVYDKHFKRNWPSPIVFYDSYNGEAQREREVLPIDYDNVASVDVEEFRVFNNELYLGPYQDYRRMMPEFKSMHLTRKTAGQSSAESETGTDCLAFQGSMRIREGPIVTEIQGSGHHGPDYVGVASVRAGKGQKVAGQAPAPYRLV